jgi:hypothetical protein
MGIAFIGCINKIWDLHAFHWTCKIISRNGPTLKNLVLKTIKLKLSDNDGSVLPSMPLWIWPAVAPSFPVVLIAYSTLFSDGAKSAIHTAWVSAWGTSSSPDSTVLYLVSLICALVIVIKFGDEKMNSLMVKSIDIIINNLVRIIFFHGFKLQIRYIKAMYEWITILFPLVIQVISKYKYNRIFHKNNQIR